MTSRSDAVEALEYDYPGIDPSKAVKAWRRIQEARGNMIVHVIIPGRPTGKARPRPGTNGGYHLPKKTVTAQSFAALCATQAMAGFDRFEEAVSMGIDIAVSPPASWSKRKRDEAICGRIRPTTKPDCDNVVKLIADAFNGIVWRDDVQVVDLTVRKRYALSDCTTVIVRRAEAA